MSHEAPHAKLIYMANQIAKFMESKPHEEGISGLSSHINDFWEPRMRRHLFEVLDAGGAGLRPLVVEAAVQIKRPADSAAA
ncbi:MAG: formate dehydrogenase [Rhodobacterales bacterium RIFCSPHIGHO2_02_FULL_62_130]|jgi:formate dehydrogenase subunit delta|nr:MAG: formate dehydrogenase [Rhodobacterales bacterium RIFCSPHIGHO2_12_FULL_62_75]OHC59692.1 MAG: formate dehydrogenase [Rhodobacterales bacterium RIFCSPHIGHO2_02_FULL_62_130]